LSQTPHTFIAFPIIQNGTHWYHSHSGLQEQIGMYGSMVVAQTRQTTLLSEKGLMIYLTVPIILSEWTDL
jgi:FtsP/CotA-like multicopper oxidase with cupredoxin domain